MNIAVYGGSFNPPHLGHLSAAKTALEALRPDKFIVMPTADPPHKRLPEDSPPADERLRMTEIAFRDMPEVEVSDMEVRRSGESYTADTVAELKARWPDAEVTLVVGTDMLLTFEQWNRFRWLLENARLAVLARDIGDDERIGCAAVRLSRDYGARVEVIRHEPLPAASSEIRQMLRRREGRQLLDDEVYARIIKCRDYGAKPNFAWLRERAYSFLKESRIRHVEGCEQEAGRLARHWGADPDAAAEAAILHDITKKLDLPEQLILCSRYGIMIDSLEAESKKLLHAKTGAALSKDLFGVPDDIYGAIRWHTTGKPAMSLLEKIMYIADYIEPCRDFDGLDELRRLAYENLDAALALGLSMTIDELEEKGTAIHGMTRSAYEFYKEGNLNEAFWRSERP